MLNQQELEHWQAAFTPPEPDSKVMTLAQAVRTFVQPGMSLHYAYSYARPNALLMQVVRQFAGQRPNFSLIAPSLVNTQTALISSGLVTRLICSFAGETYPTASPNRILGNALASGVLEIENWSLSTWVARLQAGALGLPFFPTRSLRGSGLADEHRGQRYAEIVDPFSNTGETFGVVSSLRPDITFVHAVAGDAEGNLVLSAPFGESQWGSLASKTGVIASVERIVSAEEILRHRTEVRIPSHVVRAVCHAPLGSHPYGLFDNDFPNVMGYVEDEDFMGEVSRATRHVDRFTEWMDEWILGTRDHAEYVSKLGGRKVATLRGAAAPDAWLLEQPDTEHIDSPAWTATEAMIVVSARHIARRISERNIQTVLAGVGVSHLASWLAQTLAHSRGISVQLLTEIGMYGYDPRPGEPFIFSARNMATCTSLTDVPGMLGAIVSGSENRCLGAIGAGVIDPHGNVGSTWTNEGRFIIGSGGANDIASGAADVVVTVPHNRQRMVDSVGYVTSPGTNVGCVVSSMGVFERLSPGSGYTLVSIMPGVADDAESAVKLMREECDWNFDISDQVALEEDPRPSELAVIRSFDPKRTILGPVASSAD